MSEVNMGDRVEKDWRELCVAVQNELDPTKLSLLIQDLIEALDRGERKRHTSFPPDAIDNHRREGKVGTECASA